MAMGAGSAVGRAAVDGVMNKFSGGDSSSEAPVQQQAPQVSQPLQQNIVPEGDMCGVSKKDLHNCLAENASSVAACQYFIDALSACQENNKQWA